jgi:hypothetical protein
VDDGSVDSYARSTGRDVTTEQLEFYRLRWDLKDLCGSASWFVEPHQRTTDTQLVLQGRHNLPTASERQPAASWYLTCRNHYLRPAEANQV